MNNKKKATKEEMEIAIKKRNVRLLDNAYNGKDKEIDRKKAVFRTKELMDEARIINDDNNKKVLKLLYDYSIKDVFTFNEYEGFIEYKEFATYNTYGNTMEQNRDIILNKHALFINKYKLLKHHFDNPFESFSFITNEKDRLKASRIRNLYTSINCDATFFVPEFIIRLPRDVVNSNDFFFINLLLDGFCHGLYDETQIHPSIKERHGWKYYPVIFTNKEYGDIVRSKIIGNLDIVNKYELIEN